MKPVASELVNKTLNVVDRQVFSKICGGDVYETANIKLREEVFTRIGREFIPREIHLVTPDSPTIWEMLTEACVTLTRKVVRSFR